MELLIFCWLVGLLFYINSFPDIMLQNAGERGHKILPDHCPLLLFLSLSASLLQPTAVTVRTSLLLRALPNQPPLRTTHLT